MANFDIFQRPPETATPPPPPVEEAEAEEDFELFDRPPQLFERPPGAEARPPERRPEEPRPEPEAPAAEPAAPPAPPAPAVEELQFSREERAEFRRWLQDRRFVNPNTQRRVLYRSLPAQEQARIRQGWLKGYRDRRDVQRPAELPAGFEVAQNLDEFEVGDQFFEDEAMNAGPRTVARVRERPNGEKVLVGEDGISYYQDEIQRHADGGFLRKKAEPKEEEPEPEPQGEPEYGPVQSRGDLRSRDIISMQSPRDPGSTRYYVVRMINGEPKLTRIRGRYLESYPTSVSDQDLANRDGKRIKVEDLPERYRHHFDQPIAPVPGERALEPGALQAGHAVKVGDKTYRVTRSGSDVMFLQEYDPDTRRYIGRPKEVRARDMQREEHIVARKPDAPRRKPQGTKIKKFEQLREGRIVKVFHDKRASWARVEKVEGGKVTLQRLSPRTGRPVGDPEIIDENDFEEWVHLRKISKRPAAIPEDPIVGKDGKKPEFAEVGEGELTYNYQPHRYEDVEINVGNEQRAREGLQRLLGDVVPEGVDIIHFAADLSGAGGVASSLSKLNISVGSSSISISGTGPGIGGMRRTLHFDRDGKPASISNSYFKVKGGRGRGRATKMLATQMAAARIAGFTHVSVSAAGSPGSRNYNGYYTWPALGYDAAFPSRKFNQMPAEFQERIKVMVPNAPEGLRFVHVMAAGDDVRKWWRERDHSSTLKFSLADDSPSWDALTTYVRKKARAEDQGADEFLQHAASLIRMAALILAGSHDEPEVEEGPDFSDGDWKILGEVWDEIGEKFRRVVKERDHKEARMRQVSQDLRKFARDNALVRKALMKELRRAQ